MQIKGLWLGGVMAIVALVGCGSSGGTSGTGGSTGGGGTGSGKGGASGSGKGGTTGGGGAFTTSVPAGTKVTGLTTAQAAQLCNDIESYFDNTFLPSVCQASSSLPGLEDAYFDLLQNPTASNTELQTVCASDAQDGGCSDFVDGGTGSCDISDVPSTCQATVGDYTTCINDMTTADVQLYATLPTCSSVTAASLKAFFEADGGSSFDAPEPTSCSKFDATCDVDGGTGVVSNMSRRMMPKRRR
jgi:hypothetical protein